MQYFEPKQGTRSFHVFSFSSIEAALLLILAADQKERGLLGREWRFYFCLAHTVCFDLLKQNDRKIEKICVPLASKVQKERDVGIFGFADLANVCFGFRTSKLRCFGFNFGVSCGLRVFSNLAFGFRFLSTMMTVFRILLLNAFYAFSGFAKEVTPRSHAKTVIPRDHLQLEELIHDKLSLFGSRYLGRYCCQAARRRYVG